MDIISFDGREESEADRNARIKHRNTGYANNFNKKALITGVTGQDGSYLAELLLEKGYMVVGLKRRTSTENHQRIKSIIDNPRFSLEEVEIADSQTIVPERTDSKRGVC